VLTNKTTNKQNLLIQCFLQETTIYKINYTHLYLAFPHVYIGCKNLNPKIPGEINLINIRASSDFLNYSGCCKIFCKWFLYLLTSHEHCPLGRYHCYKWHHNWVTPKCANIETDVQTCIPIVNAQLKGRYPYGKYQEIVITAECFIE
jgi:hypothetical protein